MVIAAAGSYFLGFRSRPANSLSKPAPIQFATQAPNVSAFRQPAAPERQLAGATNSFDWRQVESPDYRQYIANLRNVGCPEQTVRDIIIADVTQLYESKASALRLQAGPFEYWRTDATASPASATKQLQVVIAALDRERREVIHTLLGVNVEPQLDRMALLDELDPRLDFLPINRQKELQRIERRFTELRAKAFDGENDGEDPMEILERLRIQRDEFLNSVLSPQEREDYELRVSPTAEGLRSQLTSVPLGADEFRELFQFQQQFNTAYPANDLGLAFSTARQKERAEAEVRLQAEFRRILGEERFRAYSERNSSGSR